MVCSCPLFIQFGTCHYFPQTTATNHWLIYPCFKCSYPPVNSKTHKRIGVELKFKQSPLVDVFPIQKTNKKKIYCYVCFLKGKQSLLANWDASFLSDQPGPLLPVFPTMSLSAYELVWLPKRSRGDRWELGSYLGPFIRQDKTRLQNDSKKLFDLFSGIDTLSKPCKFMQILICHATHTVR